MSYKNKSLIASIISVILTVILIQHSSLYVWNFTVGNMVATIFVVDKC